MGKLILILTIMSTIIVGSYNMGVNHGEKNIIKCFNDTSHYCMDKYDDGSGDVKL